MLFTPCVHLLLTPKLPILCLTTSYVYSFLPTPSIIICFDPTCMLLTLCECFFPILIPYPFSLLLIFCECFFPIQYYLTVFYLPSLFECSPHSPVLLNTLSIISCSSPLTPLLSNDLSAIPPTNYQAIMHSPLSSVTTPLNPLSLEVRKFSIHLVTHGKKPATSPCTQHCPHPKSYNNQSLNDAFSMISTWMISSSYHLAPSATSNWA
jgi:hypothetical protein